MKQIERYIGKGANLSALACGFPVHLRHSKICPDLDRLVADSIIEFEYLPEGSFQLKPATDLWPVNIDEKQILYSLMNVYSFFLSFKDRGTININCENLIPDSYRLELTGFESVPLVKISIGDSQNYLGKNELLEIFTPGMSLDIKDGPDISAGLISAYWTVEKNMGRLVVTSEKENGTEFCIYLPASTAVRSFSG